ncbi:protein prenylyltransferase [Sphaerulina musiva SO2202]|uniref:Geranylgeranyl transferase type-2 subunit alpha n=1 Tax=Sphaerulina musiva (strain SO2202) TaxID=692275 RepID=N1QM34_SPHMS|nr:protein prenylyltransferase [Sphaerulina musiva SO2202]EMF16928.1 protein prenylyltransferase [Sphaerulina musiva SO2202]
MASHGVSRGSVPEKSARDRDKEKKHIVQYKALERDVFERISAHDFSHATLQLTSQLLHQNPEYYTIWNHRRVILESVFAAELDSGKQQQQQQQRQQQEHGVHIPPVEDGDAAAAAAANLTVPQREILLLIKEDLSFQIPLLKQWPKCYWIWNHRQWLLMTATQHIPAHATIDLWKAELGLVGKMLSLDSRNFHGWNYRRVVVENIERLSHSSMCEAEFAYTTQMINSNLSNFSAWHNRGQLLPRLLHERAADDSARKQAYDEEFALTTKALYTDPYDQSLWCYHQYLMSALEEHNPHAPIILQRLHTFDRIQYLAREISNIRDMLDGAEDCKYIYQALLEYSRRFRELAERDRGGGGGGGDDEKVSTTTNTTTVASAEDLTGWLAELQKIDPLRQGRWRDLERKLKSSSSMMMTMTQ